MLRRGGGEPESTPAADEQVVKSETATMHEIRWDGRGGQGAVTAARLHAEGSLAAQKLTFPQAANIEKHKAAAKRTCGIEDGGGNELHGGPMKRTIFEEDFK